MTTIEDLEMDVLVKVVEKLELSDFQNLPLVNKLFFLVVGQSGISLQPHKTVTSLQLLVLGQRFTHATSLNLRSSQLLDNSSLKCLSSLLPRLRLAQL